jgi:hypothetical protein
VLEDIEVVAASLGEHCDPHRRGEDRRRRIFGLGGAAMLGTVSSQTDFSEPLARINTHPVDTAALGWSEGKPWDTIADYYRSR